MTQASISPALRWDVLTAVSLSAVRQASRQPQAKQQVCKEASPKLTNLQGLWAPHWIDSRTLPTR